MNGLYSQAILQKQAQNAISNYTILKPVPITLKPNTKVSVPSSNNPNTWNNSAPVIDKTSSNTSSTISKTSSSTSSSGFSISGIVNTAESDFSKYFDYIIIGGAILLVFYMFSGSSNKPTKFVDIEIPE